VKKSPKTLLKTIFVDIKNITFTEEEGSQTNYVSSDNFKKQPKVNNRPIGENSPNDLVTLAHIPSLISENECLS
jgi:hypothetical protein